MQPGIIQTLRINRRTPQGYYLTDDRGNEVLLPNSFVKESMQPDDRIDVFVYTDSEDRPVATTRLPKLTLGEFALLEVVDRTTFGVFVDWGLEKDLLVPKNQQATYMETGKRYPVYLYLDPSTNRLAGSNKIENFFETDTSGLRPWQEADLLVYAETQLGYKTIVNQRFQGLIYRNEVFSELSVGDTLKGFVKRIRDDGKLDITLQKPGYGHVEPNAGKILEKLEANKGFLPFHDKSDPQRIRQVLGMSKKTFKKAIGALYKQKKIIIEDRGIRLV